jgi:hypothetical protein
MDIAHGIPFFYTSPEQGYGTTLNVALFFLNLQMGQR